MWISRAVLAFLLAAPYLLWTEVAPTVGGEAYFLRVRLAVPMPTAGQLFFDIGKGIREEDSSRRSVSGGMKSYDFRIPSGTLRGLRLDPGETGGRYTIESAEIVGPSGARIRQLDIRAISQLNQLEVVQRDSDKLVVESALGSIDPYFFFNWTEPLELKSATTPNIELVEHLLIYWLLALLAVASVERLSTRTRWPARFQASMEWHRPSPMLTLLVVSIVATAISTYPLLLNGRSLVSPANGPVSMLYSTSPFVPGANDPGFEDVRGSDVGATMWAFVPYSKVQRDALLHGDFPLWNRYNGSGRALWGQGQSFLLDPLHWLTLASADPAVGWDLKFVAHRVVFSFGIGVASLLATGAMFPAAVAATVAPFAGLFTFRLNHAAVFTVTYAPWILVGWFLMATVDSWAARWRVALLLVAATSLTLVASTPKEALIMLGACYATGALFLARASMGMQNRLKSLLAAAAAAAIALLLCTPHWLVFLDTLAAGRSFSDSPGVIFASTDAALAFVLGNLTPGSLQPGLQPLAVGLAICTLFAPAMLRAKPALAACAISAIGLTALAFGIIPVVILVQVPLVGNIFHFGDVVMAALTVPVLVLAAGGAQLLYGSGRSVRVPLTIMLAIAGLVVLSYTGGWPAFSRFDQWLNACVLAIVVSIPFLLSALRRHSGRALPQICIVACVLLLSDTGGLQLRTERPVIDHLLPQPGARLNLAANSPAIEQAIRNQSTPTRTVGLGFLLFQGTQALYGLEGIGGPDALQIKAYEDLLDAGGIDHFGWSWLTVVAPETLDRLSPLLDLLNVGMVVTNKGQHAPGLLRTEDDLDPRIDIAFRPSAWPRAFFVDGVRNYQTPAELIQIVREEKAPLAAVSADDLFSQRQIYGLPKRARTMAAATDYRLSANKTMFTVRATGPGVAVLTETYLKDDFRATLNGKRVPYLRVNHAFKGVSIPSAGIWEVTFVYRPRHWTIAWICAAIGVLLSVSLGIWSVRRDRTPALGQT